ncbi:hypothetical protein CIY_17550 [Butyrivibrio fibrisolvens 16/4]|nr:hypothetical protein CIY_17550 [Butyrivibrio fibrisolvens 16/4]
MGFFTRKRKKRIKGSKD